jgi:hypothetical protein
MGEVPQSLIRFKLDIKVLYAGKENEDKGSFLGSYIGLRLKEVLGSDVIGL